MQVRTYLVAVVVLLLVSCASGTRQRRPYLLRENLDNAARHLEAGRREEAAQIYEAVRIADPMNTEACSNLQAIGKHSPCMMKPCLLGQNLVRKPRGGSTFLRIVAYPVSRVLDVLDAVSFELGPQGGLYAGAHATRALQFSLGAGGGAQLGWWQKRELGVGAGHVAGLSLIPFSAQGEGWTRVGTRGARNVAVSAVGFNHPSDFVYQRSRDYWSVGVRMIALAFGGALEIHPVEAVDAVAGLLFIDFLRDDIGSTHGLKLSRADVEAMEELINTLSPKELRARMRGELIEPVADPGAPSGEGAVIPDMP